ncbi:MAG TPA: phosphatidate cytidylyltransferase [Anaerolineae bacterium]|nr:phosphatidate cytidylyltransferase [Anaerolineae bacterium]
MLRTRVLSSALLIPLVAAATWAGGWILAAVLFVVVVRSAYELFHLMEQSAYRPSLPASALVMAAFLVSARFPEAHLTGAVLAAAVIGTLIVQLLRPPKGQPTQSWALTLGAALWLGWLISHFLLLRDLSSPFGFGVGTRWLGLVFLVTWLNDSAAYFVGKAFGRHPFAPYLSPKKTWEGTAGGVIGGVAGTMLLGHWLVGLPWLHGLLLGALVAIVAPLGDLAKSMVKRQVGVKDFSDLIPGHGGMFDRIDSLLFVAPVVYCYATFILPLF